MAEIHWNPASIAIVYGFYTAQVGKNAPATRQGFERLHLEALAKVNRSKERLKMIMPMI